MNTGPEIVLSDFGLLTTVAFQVPNIFHHNLASCPSEPAVLPKLQLKKTFTKIQLGSSPPMYALEGSISYAGSTVQVGATLLWLLE